MPFRITITDEAEAQLFALSARERGTAETAIVARLRDQPTVPTKAVKRLRPNPVCEFELRVGDLRVLYDVVDEEVIVLIIGRKVGNTLVVNGEEFHEHQADPPQSSGGGPSGNAD
jgi:mRNA-degrading endonuclease RelE of RelBE toxin-antitoxin system